MENRQETEELNIPDVLPLLPVRDVVVYPYMILPLFVGREISINAVDYALSKDRMIFLATQRDVGDEDPAPEAIYEVGTVAMIMRMLKLPDGRVKILVQGLTKARVTEYLAEKPFYSVRIERIVEPAALENTLEAEALIRTVKEELGKIVALGKAVSPEVMVIVENMQEPGSLADLVASNIGLKVEEAQGLLEVTDPLERLKRVNDFLNKESELLNMQARIQSAAKEEMGKSQREYYLREQLRAIQQELGETDARS
ncbi:MAG TPA: endopeptidase La, partial [Geobacter sp.]|nr:endopeptidase La [Geobacter sp.]